jgi:hypothetical protein
MNTRTNEVSVLVADSNESHGVTEDARGRLISAQAWDGSTRIGVIYPPESRAVLADAYEGRPFSRPNDLIVARTAACTSTIQGSRAAGRGTREAAGKTARTRLPPAVYYIPPGGRAIRIEDRMIRPNGIQLSRDEKTLYSSDSNGSESSPGRSSQTASCGTGALRVADRPQPSPITGLCGIKHLPTAMTNRATTGRLYCGDGRRRRSSERTGRHLGTNPSSARQPTARTSRSAGRKEGRCMSAARGLSKD